jgi:hypothetical protein
MVTGKRSGFSQASARSSRSLEVMVAPFLPRIQRLVPARIKAQFNSIRSVQPGVAAPQSSAEVWQNCKLMFLVAIVIRTRSGNPSEAHKARTFVHGWG